ncbi:hypothetical protein niasHT_021662 [Heterodera trifolii]|uniref:Uncharacterized protein n=1 Tax=Heterodera trifolii TaxID=157864 RepID=A0ABD2JSJ1_9BILA
MDSTKPIVFWNVSLNGKPATVVGRVDTSTSVLSEAFASKIGDVDSNLRGHVTTPTAHVPVVGWVDDVSVALLNAEPYAFAQSFGVVADHHMIAFCERKVDGVFGADLLNRMGILNEKQIDAIPLLEIEE